MACWRLNPPPGIHARVQEMATQEGRSVSNLLVRLVGEALTQRSRDAALRGEKDQLIELLRKQASSIDDNNALIAA
jgi:CopG-like RHH_1 or ribbon-helix-helix domain, RHH_5